MLNTTLSSTVQDSGIAEGWRESINQNATFILKLKIKSVEEAFVL